MKSNKQKRLALAVKRQRRENKQRGVPKQPRVPVPYAIIPVNATALQPYVSYGAPLFVTRGFYVDLPFICKDCGKEEIWTATQQKWWYEIAKGEVWTSAIRCRSCRRRERERQAEARRIHLEGVTKKYEEQQTLSAPVFSIRKQRRRTHGS